jgi:hypothetical protein
LRPGRGRGDRRVLAQGKNLVGADGSALDHDQFRDDFSQAYGERVPGMASVAAPEWTPTVP